MLHMQMVKFVLFDRLKFGLSYDIYRSFITSRRHKNIYSEMIKLINFQNRKWQFIDTK